MNDEKQAIEIEGRHIEIWVSETVHGLYQAIYYTEEGEEVLVSDGEPTRAEALQKVKVAAKKYVRSLG